MPSDRPRRPPLFGRRQLSSGKCSIRKLLPQDADATYFDPELGWCTPASKCAPFLASRFDPDADGLTSEEQAVYDPAASAFVLEEGVCTALPHLSTVITTSDPRLPDENLPHSYKFTCTDNWRDRGVPSCRAPSRHRRASSPGEEVAARFFLDFDHGLTPRSKGQLAWYIGSDDCDEAEIPQLEGFEGSYDIKEGDPDTLRTFTFEGASACFESSATFGFQGLPSLSMTFVGDARCPCD